jgi:hypothetical protein
MLSAGQASGVGGPNALNKIQNFYGTNLDELKKFNSELDELKSKKDITLTVVGEVFGAEEVAAITKDAKYFKALNKNNKITYAQTFDTYYNMIGTHEFDQMYISWAAGDGKNEKDKSPTGYVAWLARKATELKKQQDALNSDNGDGTGGDPQASFLDDIVKGIRDTLNWQQKLTLGWDASKKAIQDFFKAGKTGFNGLMEKLTGQRVQDTLMQQMLGLSKEDYEAHKSELIDQYGKLTKFGQQVQTINQAVSVGTYIANQQIARAENERYTASLNKLEKAGVNAALAIELMKDAQFASTIAGANQKQTLAAVAEALKTIKSNYDKLSDSEKEQKGITLLQAGLDVISDKEAKINKTYDDRIKALDEVSKINSEISAAQQDQMDIAEALSRGDISAAAKAQKNMISNDAQRAVQNAKDMLNSQREQEINNITVDINGNLTTRAEITERIAEATASIHTDTLAQLGALMVVSLTGKLPKPKPYATGGHIIGAGTGTSDNIPAMLSNGEYVIRANAVKTIGVSTLDKLNQADRMHLSGGGMAIPRFADGGYNGPRPSPQWDAKGRWVVSRGESYWSTAENTLPGGMDVGSWWSRILKSNIDPETGKERRLYRNSRIWIPGSEEPYPPKSGIPRIFPKKKKPLYIGGGEISIHENHLYGGNGGGGLLGNMTKVFANGGMVGYKDGGKAKSWDLKDPSAPWNQGDYKKFNDYQTRKQYWAMSQPGSKEIVDVGKNIGYFTPGIGSGLAFGDAGTAFGKGDVGGGLLNTAFGFGAMWIPKAIGMIGKGLGAAGDFIKTGLGIRGGSNALKAAASSTGADVSKVGKLAPRLGFNLSDAALHSMVKDNFYGNMRTGIRSSTSDSLMNRIAVEKNMMGIPANAPASKTPAYGFLTTKEDVPSYYNSIMGGMGPRSKNQEAIDEFNLLINPMSRYTGFYGSNTIKLKANALGRSTISMGDSLSIWDKAIGLKQKFPKVNKLSSIFSTFSALSGKLKSTQGMMKKDIPGITSPTRFPYIEAHLPGGFTVKDIESIMLHPTGKFGPQAKDKIAADLAERKAALEALFESMGIKGIKITENGGIKIGDKALDGNYPLPTKGPKSPMKNPFAGLFSNFAKLSKKPQTSNEIANQIKFEFTKSAKKSQSRINNTKQLAQKALAEHEASLGKPLPEWEKEYFLNTWTDKYMMQKQVANAVKNPAIMTRRSVDSVIKMLTENKTQTLFDTGRSAGNNSQSLRKVLEEELFGQENVGKTIYGYLVNKGMLKNTIRKPRSIQNKLDNYLVNPTSVFAEHYGPAGILLKPKITRKASLTPGDSLNMFYSENIKKMFGTTPQPKVNFLSKNGITNKNRKSVLGNIDAEQILKDSANYIEAQIPGGYIPRADIAAIYVKTAAEAATLKAAIKQLKLRIPVRLFDDKPVVQKISDGLKNIKKKNIPAVVKEDDPWEFANGGLAIPKFKVGGYVGMMPKFGDGGLANLHQGEYVFQKSAVDRIGLNNLNAMNQGDTVSGDSVYNYSINVNVKSDANASQIADTVLRQIKQIDSQRLRSVRV